MKKILALTLALLCLLALAACNGSQPAATDPTAGTTVTPKPEEAFYLHFSNQDLIPGTEFPAGWLPEPNFSTETPDCVNGGLTRLHMYDYLQVTTYEKDGKQIIYSVILDPEKAANTPTAEGLYFGDDSARVEELYGANAVKDGDIWTYTKGATQLIIQLDSDQVIGLEYKEA